MYRSDIHDADVPAGIVRVVDQRGRVQGRALWSPTSEIRLRLLTTEDCDITRGWWQARIGAARDRRMPLESITNAYRAVHAEADGLPALIIDRYADHAVVQLLSAGLETVRGDVLGAIVDVLSPESILLRNDASVRRHEGLSLTVEEAYGSVPPRVEIREATRRFGVDLRSGQKTGGFLDQRDNRLHMAKLAVGHALDLFTYQGWFAIHLAERADAVRAVDTSEPALEQARHNAQRNACTNIEWIDANAFDELRTLERAGARFDTIVLDPPAFAKRRDNLERALAGYKELNLRAMRLLTPGGHLLTCSCSYHVTRSQFLEMLRAAAADCGRRIELERHMGQSADHPEVLTIPETGYLKGALLRAAH